MTSNIRLATALKRPAGARLPGCWRSRALTAARRRRRRRPRKRRPRCRPPIPPRPPRQRPRRTRGRRGGRSAMQDFRPQDKRGLNVYETTKTPGVEFTGFKLDFQRRLHLAGPVAQPPQYRHAGDRQRRQHQPARRHRLRLQQLDRELRPQRAARSRHSRRAHQLPVLAASQRDVGQGRLPADGRVADRLGAAQGIHADHDGSASATSRSTTATRTSAAATTATPSTTRSSATTSWTRSRPRSAARSTSRPRASSRWARLPRAICAARC